MNSAKISPSDPRLSAYAFGEMEASEAAAFALELERDPEARRIVDDLGSLGIQLSDTLKVEASVQPAPPVTDAPSGASVYPFPVKRTASAWRDRLLWCGGLATAACLTWVAVEPTLLPSSRVPTAAKKATEAREQRLEQEPMRTSSPTVEQLRGLVTPTEPAPVVAIDEDSAPVAEVPEERVVLSPFEVEATVDDGYVTTNTLAGTWLSPQLADVGSAVKVVTPQVLRDVGSTSSESLLNYTSNTEVGGRTREAVKLASAAELTRSAKLARLPKPEDPKGEGYAPLAESGFSLVSANPTSTFSIDVDTASYANLRRFVTSGQRPPREAVRIEEMVNAFRYAYAAPTVTSPDPVAASLEVASAPWAPSHRLVRIGLKAKDSPAAERPAANLVFLLDVSGSMSSPNKLPLAKEALRLLVAQLRPQDRVAIVVYAGASGLALPSTSGEDKSEILRALDGLQPGGSTAGAMGIQLAYDVAKANFIAGGANRVILCTDGDFNVGVTSQTELQTLITQKAQSGVFLSVLGFGMGNYQDKTLEMLADKGNGNYGYIDSAKEARRLLVEQAGGTLVTVAKDVKVQVEFNPAKVAAYRLIGYENRRLKREDFTNDRIDAGELGAGHTVTALYEVIPVGGAIPGGAGVEPLRYASTGSPGAETSAGGEWLHLAVRYKPLDSDTSRRLSFPLREAGGEFSQASADFRFAAAVAAYGLVLTDSPHRGGVTLRDVEAWATAAVTDQEEPARREFVDLVRKTESLTP